MEMVGAAPDERALICSYRSAAAASKRERRAEELVWTWSRWPVSGSMTPRIPTAGSSNSRGSVTWTATTWWRSARRATEFRQSDGVEEVGHHHDLASLMLGAVQAVRGRQPDRRRGRALGARGES